MMVLDDFLNTYDELKMYSLTCDYADEVNESDGVTYPHICKKIPDNIRESIYARLEEFKGSPIQDPLLFLRASPEGCDVPQIAHTDAVMGDYSLMLYLTGEGQTSFLRHIDSGIMYQPQTQTYIQTIERHQNMMGKWFVWNSVSAKENRGCIFDASYIHCAEPIGGCGHGSSQRTVATCFFS